MKKNIFILFGVGVLVIGHILMTLIFLSPDNLIKNKLGKTAFHYMKPFFYQNWHLFSPNPGISSTKLWVRCEGLKGKWNDWEDPFSSIQEDFYKNRFSGKGKLLRVYQELSKGVVKEYDDIKEKCMKEKNDTKFCLNPSNYMKELLSGPAYQLADDFAMMVCSKRKDGVGYQVKVITFFPKKYSERNDDSKQWSRVEDITFPKQYWGLFAGKGI